jgi:hypothetical protein
MIKKYSGIITKGFDMAKGMELAQIYRSGYLVLAISALIGLAIVANSKRITAAEMKTMEMAL